MQVDKVIIINGLGADYVPPSMPVGVRAGHKYHGKIHSCNTQSMQWIDHILT